MTIDLTNGIAILVAVLGLIGMLIKMIRDADMKRLVSVEKDRDEAKKEFIALNASLSSTKQRSENNSQAILVTEKRLEDTMSRHFTELNRRLDTMDNSRNAAHDKLSKDFDHMREAIADVRETMAGFGATYVSRKEYSHDAQTRHEDDR